MDFVPLLVPVFVAILTAFGIKKNQDKKINDTQLQSEQVSEENARLRKRVADLEVLLKNLNEQVTALSGYKVLYETLKESHELLKNDYDELKTRVDKLNDEYESLKTQHAATNEANEKLRQDLFETKQENVQLKHEIGAYTKAFALLGIKLAEEKEGAETVEKADQQASEDTEAKQESTSDG